MCFSCENLKLQSVLHKAPSVRRDWRKKGVRLFREKVRVRTCGRASPRRLTGSISCQHANLWLLSQCLLSLYVRSGGQGLRRQLQSNSHHWSQAKVSSGETAAGGGKKRKVEKNSDNCTHFLWKACWHGNTPSSSFTLKSSKHTAHVCCVTDRERWRLVTSPHFASHCVLCSSDARIYLKRDSYPVKT